MTSLTLTSKQREFLLAFDAYQLEGRYPDFAQKRTDERTGGRKLTKAEEMRKWLTARL